MILLDTNVISELMRAEPNQKVQKWVEKQAIESLFLSSITLAEIYFGLEVLP
ncbi:MAG: PIN domain-containing protein, partial [Neisseriaceae bacterium]|nr:PIN domain-containing protein [Neisseriaceae bacterium]